MVSPFSEIPDNRLVVEKRNLPSMLRNVVPPLVIGATAAPLIATSNRLWGPLHSSVGRRVKHGEHIATVTNVHEQLREIEINGERFWIPKADTRHDMQECRQKALFDSGIKTTFGSPPNWTGDTRPFNARRVRAHSRFPSVGYLTHLVKDLGYDGNAAFAAMTHGHQPWLRSSDRHRGDAPHQYSPIPSIKHPYVAAAPSRRTQTGGGFTDKQVADALAGRHWEEKMKRAVSEVVYRRRSALEVSDESGIAVEVLSVYASRLRTKIRTANSHLERKAA